MDLIQGLSAFCPWNEQEAQDRLELLRRLQSGESLYDRENTSAHLTASAWVVSPDRTRVLMAYHNLTPGRGWAAMPTASGICWLWPSGKYRRRAG